MERSQAEKFGVWGVAFKVEAGAAVPCKTGGAGWEARLCPWFTDDGGEGCMCVCVKGVQTSVQQTLCVRCSVHFAPLLLNDPRM